MKDQFYYFDIQHKDSCAVILVTIRAKTSDEAMEKLTDLFKPSHWVVVREVKALS